VGVVSDGGHGPGWLLDERATAGRENFDPAHVSRYDTKEAWDAASEIGLLRSLGMNAGSTVLDLGAGTGQFTLAVAPTCSRVVAADVSEPMLERLRAKVTTAGLDNVDVVGAGFVSYEHDGPPVDVAYSRYALHHVPDFWKAHALVRLAGCMRPGGLLRLWDIVYSFPLEAAGEHIERWCASLPGTGEDTDWVRADVEEHVRDEHSTFAWLLEPMLERSGFDIEAAEYSDDGIFARYVARRR
jgi:cyclopropane fatty-acyl-phospholipid synthase-like methyltransferase